MVFKLPSARCLSKASRDGALSENMANADINASLKGISTSSTRSSAMVAKCSRSKRKSASAQRYLRPFGTTMDIATLNLTSSTCDIVPMRAVLWHSCLRKARGDTGVVTGIYRPPGIAVSTWPSTFLTYRQGHYELFCPKLMQRYGNGATTAYAPSLGHRLDEMVTG